MWDKKHAHQETCQDIFKNFSWRCYKRNWVSIVGKWVFGVANKCFGLWYLKMELQMVYSEKESYHRIQEFDKASKVVLQWFSRERDSTKLPENTMQRTQCHVDFLVVGSNVSKTLKEIMQRSWILLA